MRWLALVLGVLLPWSSAHAQAVADGPLIAEYEALLRETPADDPLRPDLMRRLAEACWQRSQLERLKASDSAVAADKAAGGKKAALERQQRQHEQQAKAFAAKAVTTYSDLVALPAFATYARADEVLFELAQAQDAAAAIATYRRLLKDYPASAFVPDAWLAIGEDAFMAGNLAQAGQAYDQVLRFPRHRLYAYALYKKGWVAFNLGQPKDAFQAWAQVTQMATGKNDATLRREAGKDCVRAFAEFGDPALALRTFEKLDKSRALELYALLGELYVDQGKSAQAITVYRELMQRAPQSPAVCEWQARIVDATRRIGSPAEQAREAEDLTRLYEYLARKAVLPPDRLETCRQAAQARP